VKSALIEERKRAEESRIMFLRYVFHEIRVPLNSISLGLQVLNVTSRLDLSEKDVINTMLDGEGLHVYTCNDDDMMMTMLI
jgi:signal transduction histidine kinase